MEKEASSNNELNSQKVSPKELDTQLIINVKKGNFEKTKNLIQNGANVNSKDDEKKTPLHWAVEEGFIDIVNILIEAQADVEQADDLMRNPLHTVATINETKPDKPIKDEIIEKLVQILLTKNKDLINKKDVFEYNPLWLAVENNNLAAVIAISKFQDISELITGYRMGKNIFCDYFEVGKDSKNISNKISNKIFKILIDAKGDINARLNNKFGDSETPLQFMIIEDHYRGVQILIDNGADVNKEDERGNTPLRYAIMHFKLEAMSILIQNGADVNKEDEKGKTPLYYVIIHIYSRLEAISILTENGADVNKEDKSGNTPLDYAIIYNKLEAISILVQNGADVKLLNPYEAKKLEALMNTNDKIKDNYIVATTIGYIKQILEQKLMIDSNIFMEKTVTEYSNLKYAVIVANETLEDNCEKIAFLAKTKQSFLHIKEKEELGEEIHKTIEKRKKIVATKKSLLKKIKKLEEETMQKIFNFTFKETIKKNNTTQEEYEKELQKEYEKATKDAVLKSFHETLNKKIENKETKEQPPKIPAEKLEEKLEEDVQRNITESLYKYCNNKEYELHFMLHLNEDFDDDLLGDAIKLLDEHGDGDGEKHEIKLKNKSNFGNEENINEGKKIFYKELKTIIEENEKKYNKEYKKIEDRVFSCSKER